MNLNIILRYGPYITRNQITCNYIIIVRLHDICYKQNYCNKRSVFQPYQVSITFPEPFLLKSSVGSSERFPCYKIFISPYENRNGTKINIIDVVKGLKLREGLLQCGNVHPAAAFIIASGPAHLPPVSPR